MKREQLTMDRRRFLQIMGAGVAALSGVPRPSLAMTSNGDYGNLLILIELKGGNDGLNAVIPYDDPLYYRLRSRLAIPREQIVQLAPGTGLHPQLAKLQPLWEKKELAVVQGIGYPDPNLSHFRSIEIWDTASKSDEYLEQGWLTRNFLARPAPREFAADGVIVGSNDMGPLGGDGVRAISLANTETFLRQARLARPSEDTRNAALKHILAVERDIVQAAGKLNSSYAFKTEFPPGKFGNIVKTAAQLAASNGGIAAMRLTHNGFDTHANQFATQGNLLRELGEGIDALKLALLEINRWNAALIMTYAEFGRRPQENESGGTDHGTASAHFVTGGKVRGGLYGRAPQLDRLDGNGNLAFAVDFRSLYATVLERWWNVDSKGVLGQKYPTLDLIRT
jgi:uncharacterized protein (DUF1501 family)